MQSPAQSGNSRAPLHRSRNRNPLTALATFKAFTAKVAERTEEPPVTVELAAVGTYGF